MTEFSDAKAMLVTLCVTLPRLIALFATLPFLNQQLLSGLARHAFALSLTVLLVPLVHAQQPAELTVMTLLLIIVKEVGIGVGIGYLITLFFQLPESIGFFVDNQRGAAMAAVFDPMAGHQTSPLGSLLFQLVIVLLMTSGGFLLLLGGLFTSYQRWPVYTFFPQPNPAGALFFLERVDQFTALTLLLAAPLVIAVFVSEFGLGLVNRFAPQLNVFFLAMPVKSAVAAFLLLLYLVPLLEALQQQAAAFPALLAVFTELIDG